MEQEMTLDLSELFLTIRKRLTLLLSITLTLTLLSGLISFFVLTPVYESKISIIIGRAAESDIKNKTDFNDVMMYQKLSKTYAEIAKSETVAQRTINDLNLNMEIDKFIDNLIVTPQPDTQIIVLKYQSTDPKQATEIINKLAQNFITESKRFYPDGNVQIIDFAKVPQNPVKPKKALNIAIAFVLGVMLSLGIIFILEYMDNTVKTEQDIENITGLPVIGIIPQNNE